MMNKSFLSLSILFCFILGFLKINAKECGRKSEFEPMVFGGEIAKKAEWPWNVALMHRQEKKFFCGGTLISTEHVLSAAHCFQSKGIREPLSPLLVEVLLGKFDLNVENETGSEASLVTEIVIHPDWKYEQFDYDADLAVVVLEREVTFNIFIQPICLPERSDDVVSGTGTVVGWGKSKNSGGTHANVPSKLELPAIDPATCYTTFHQLGRYSSPRMFCGGFANETKAPCLGDSGGGFFFKNGEVSWEIRGIVSGSLKTIEHGCDINKFVLFTYVAKFADWIKEKMIETTTVDWKFVNFKCVEHNTPRLSPFWTGCYTTFEEPMTRNLKIRTDFSSHRSKSSSIEVTQLAIDFSHSMHILPGIGKKFPNLKSLHVEGRSIKFIERQNFANLTKLDRLLIFRTLITFLPADLLADLPDLRVFEIFYCLHLQRLPENFFMNQRQLKKLHFGFNGLTILQRDLFKNNLELEVLRMRYNPLKEIYVDFTRLPAIESISLNNIVCISVQWEWEIGPIESLQATINLYCQPIISF